MKNYYRCLVIKTVYKGQRDRHKGQGNRIWSSRFMHKLNNVYRGAIIINEKR